MTTSHTAPAGQTYQSVKHAGECILRDSADGFPSTDKSFIFPPKFTSEYPEPINEATGDVLKTSDTLTKKEQDRYVGKSIDARAEEAEYLLFKKFEKIASKNEHQPQLFLRNYELSQNVEQDFRTSVLTEEMKMNFQDLNTRGELDAVVVRADGCMVIIEVKSKYTQKQHDKAEDQAERGSRFFKRIMEHISGSPSCVLPVVKVVIFPFEDTPSPTDLSDKGSHIIHSDRMVNFEEKWADIMKELDSLKANNSFSKDHVIKFIRVITGVWCMEPYKRKSYRFNDETASTTHLIEKHDDQVNRAIFTSDVRIAKNESKIPPPVAAAELCRPIDGFPNCVGMDLIYLTPDQKHLLKKVPSAIVRGCAGSGKTIIMFMKIKDILDNDPVKNIIIVVPEPHDAHVQEFLKANGFYSVIYETFSSPPPNGVIIMTLEKFFEVTPEILHSYDISNHHFFVDDFQSLWFGDRKFSYNDVVQFIENTYNNHLKKNLQLFCALDEAQSAVIGANSNTNIMSLFYIDKHTPRQLNIPIFILNKILRNTVEIANVSQTVRDTRIELTSSTVLPNFIPGHRIRSESVRYHKLTKWTSRLGIEYEDWKMHGCAFVVERTRDELTKLLKKPNHLKKNSIAILYDEHFYKNMKPAVTKMLWDSFQINPQTIRESLTSNNDTIIFDHYDQVTSFECACVIMLYGGSMSTDSLYNIITKNKNKNKNKNDLFSTLTRNIYN